MRGGLDPRPAASAMPNWAQWTAPWAGVSAKLRHAWDHLQKLRSSVEQFVLEPPLRVDSASVPDRGPNWLRVDLLVDHPDESLSLSLGDFLHNLRCALDHSLTVLDPKGARRLTFPIYSTEAEFDRWVRRQWRSAGGSEDVQRALREHQPFVSADGRDPENYALRILARLNNADKHRLLHLMPVNLSDRRPRTLEVTATTEILNVEWVLPTGPAENRQAAIFVELDRPADECGVGVKGTIPISVAIERYDEAVGLCYDLHDAVMQTCGDLRRLSAPG